jgi:hypothetical protein
MGHRAQEAHMDTAALGRWNELAGEVGAALARLRPGRFLLIEYHAQGTWDPRPYAQCAREVDSWYCEVVSQNYLGASTWPIDELAMRRTGWLLPDDETANWWRNAETAEQAAELLVDGLRHGRLCPDPEAFAWSVGTFPSGPDGGEPLPIPVEELIVQAA